VSVEWDNWTATGQTSGPILELSGRPEHLSLAVGPQVMTVSVVPGEPWHEPSKVTLEFFVVNLYMLFGGLAVLCVLIALVAVFRHRHGIELQPFAVRPATAVTGFRVAPRPVDGLAYEGNRQLVLRFYRHAARSLERATGVADLPVMTLREFGVAVRRHSSLFVRLFGRLTELTEQALYSARETLPGQLRLARRLSLTIEARVDDSHSAATEGDAQ
jgi:hypothetical protein